MPTSTIIKMFLELIACVLLIWGIVHEQEIVEFERYTWNFIRYEFRRFVKFRAKKG